MNTETEETFFSHLIELRARLIRAVLAVLLVFLCLAYWAQDLYALLAQPLLASLLPLGGKMIATDVVGVFIVPIKVALMTAFLITLPYVLYQAWAFIAPGLYQHEKKIALPLLVASVCLFFLGMSFAYFLVFPAAFHIMSTFVPEGVAWMTDIDKYLSFVLTTLVAFGMAFEVPVVEILLVRAGIVNVGKLKEYRSYAIVGAFIIGAVLTPPDIFSQVMLAVPLCLLYEIGIFCARFTSPSPREESGLMSEEDLQAALTDAMRQEEGGRENS
ncbi:MAG: twin-arginine translocase subunit TatC [Zoogloeaceae bacterium]|jgi:sec-independent protein translocase protein TatC|nr:twin-arginine translocase subunit TatC [Zoogloeaceae bacterium]